MNKIKTFRGKVAIVTGTSRGIGAGIAFELARRGAKVAGTYTSQGSEKAMEALIEKIDGLGNGSQAIKIKADLRDPSVPKQILEQTFQAFGTNVDILINNAGAELVKPLQEITVEDFASIYDLNVRGPLLMTQAVLPHLRRPGRIINISSVGARYGFKDLSVYCSSKAALEGLTRCWAAELGAAGHTVNAVNPGPVQTQLMENIPKEYIEMQKSQTPVENRIGTVDDIAQIVAWLASEESRWISGQVISASGGWAMY
ncbi:dehydrogenase with different specificitie [Parathielavia appendiculata]|uniref:Dehydrogenase with different specificitie n=1 Tax=Parathielavia appendiculata TaxID=2587402 RepID=A0AAN6TPS3_9PEZI|nr:dehydrogenase with different specificitie [Parathielavia appendiculata]